MLQSLSIAQSQAYSQISAQGGSFFYKKIGFQMTLTWICERVRAHTHQIAYISIHTR